MANLLDPDALRAEVEAARAESAACTAAWVGSELLTGTAATTASVRGALAGADLGHVAAPGTHQQESPLFSSLRVGDGPLYAYELDAADRAAPCVVLSACEAGLAMVRPGDEPASFVVFGATWSPAPRTRRPLGRLPPLHNYATMGGTSRAAVSPNSALLDRLPRPSAMRRAS